ncbi:MAG: hypothetical protein ABSC92_09455 [Rhizomicrobium sp.]|jgi:hypothetical protein
MKRDTVQRLVRIPVNMVTVIILALAMVKIDRTFHILDTMSYTDAAAVVLGLGLTFAAIGFLVARLFSRWVTRPN